MQIKTEQYARPFHLLQFIEKSRQEIPNPEILIKRRKQLDSSSALTPKDIETKNLIDEVVIRLAASPESGVSTFEVFEFIGSDKNYDIKEAELLHEIWSLVDTGILDFTPDRLLTLSPEAREQFK